MHLRQPFTFGLALLVAAVSAGTAAGQTEPERFKTQLELGFNGASGNSSFSILRTGIKTTHLRTDVAEFEASLLVRYGKNDEKVIADDAKAAVKLDLWPGGRWSPFLFADAGRDEIRRLDARFSGGAGAKLTVWDGESGDASLSFAGLYDYQNFKVDAGSPDPKTKSNARWSLRTKVEKKLSATASFQQVAFYQPVWDDGSDYIMDLTHSVSTQVLGNLSLAVEHQFLRDASPPPGVEPDDQRFSVVLKVAF